MSISWRRSKLLATQQARIEKDRALIRGAPGTSAAERYMREDFSIAVQGFRMQLENAAAAMGAPLAKALTPAVNAASDALAVYAQRVQANTMALSNNPPQALPSQRRFNRFMNNQVLGIDSDDAVIDIPDTKIRDHDLKVARDNLQRRIAQPARIKNEQESSEKWKRDHSVLASLGFGGDYTRVADIIGKDSADAKTRLDALDRATFARMVVEHQIEGVRNQLKASRELYYRLDRRGSATVPGSLAMPLSVGYGGVDVPIMSTGAHRPPVVTMPEGFGRAPREQDVHVGFDPAKIDVTVRVDASSALLTAVADAKRQTATVRAFTRGPVGMARYGVTSCEAIRSELRRAAADDAVSWIVLMIDSGGGYVSGVDTAGEAILAARAKKPVIAVVEGMAASAAYWLASQCDAIVMSPCSDVGSIGVIMMHVDVSRAMDAAGLKVTLIHGARRRLTSTRFSPCRMA